ncbi:DoxX family protein [Streptomyces netropsis]
MKVPSDPAQVVVNHVSFRVQLARPPRAARQFAGIADTAQLPTVRSAAKRRAPVVWSGRTEPGESAPTQLLQAIRDSGAAGPDPVTAGGHDAGSTQVLPRIRVDDAPTTVIGPRGPAEPTDTTGTRSPTGPGTQLLQGVRPTHSAYDEEAYDHGEFDGRDGRDEGYDEDGAPRRPGDSVRHAYYPGRRMNLGVVLLPLRVFLGFISIYAGMGKLCDPVYFDGGRRGSMVTWLTSLHPWPVASPLRDLALSHPVGAGLTVAFLQVVVGVLTIFGLWQRVAASIGVLLSATLLVTVSWRSVPAYDAPDIIYLAAWSPLVIAGAPFYSIDGRLASEAWRRLGPRAELWELRRRVLRRGTIMATVLIGLSLLIGSTLGGAVRSSEVARMPGPADPPTNHLPGSPLPRKPGSPASPRGSQSAVPPAPPSPPPPGGRRRPPPPPARPRRAPPVRRRVRRAPRGTPATPRVASVPHRRARASRRPPPLRAAPPRPRVAPPVARRAARAVRPAVRPAAAPAAEAPWAVCWADTVIGGGRACCG